MSIQRWQRLACFADTGFFYALTDTGDRWHADSVAVLKQVQEQGRFIVCSPLIVAESYALIRYRVGYEVAIEWLKNLRAWVEVIPIADTHEQKAIAILQQYADQKFTFTDAVSFAMIEELEIRIALSTDKHFQIYHGAFLTFPLAGRILPNP